MSGNRGVVDVTSTGDYGHLLKKQFSPLSFQYAVESLYPSVDFSDLSSTPLAVSETGLATVAAVRAQRANAALSHWLGDLRSFLSLVLGAPGNYPDDVISAATTAKKKIARIASSGVSSDLLDDLNAAIEYMNGIDCVEERRTVKAEIEMLQEKYGVSDDPPWG